MNKKRILFYSEGWGSGGIESFIMNDVRALDHDRYDFEIFCVHDYDNLYDKEIEELGGVRHTVFKGHKPNNLKRLVDGPREWSKLLSDKTFDIVHVNTMNGMGLRYVDLAKRAGVTQRIAHSHNSDVGQGAHGVKMVLHDYGRYRWTGAATDRLACSRVAGEHLFGGASFQVLPGAIDAERYRFSQETRDSMREDLGIPFDSFVMGFIGRLDDQKDPLKVLDIFCSVAKKNPKAHLILIGQGELKEKVESAIAAMPRSSSDRIHLVPHTDNVPAYLSAFDVLVQPSQFEGLGLVLVEAQASGLQAVVSDAFPEESTVIIDDVIRLPLHADVEQWAAAIEASPPAGPEDRVARNLVATESPFGAARFKQSIDELYS